MPTPPLVIDGRPRPAALFLAVHEAFRRDAARGAAVAGRVEDAPRARRLARHWELYAGMLLSHHHAEEAEAPPPGCRPR
ncbi:MAG: hypothetical protein WD010_05945 [Nitriliruptor sp.]